MNIYLNSLDIYTYRGIRNLKVKDFSSINILVGNNNSGKTSLLEAIKILSQPYDIANVIRVINSRSRTSQANFIDTILSAFTLEEPDKNEKNINMRDSYYIKLGGNSNNNNISLDIYGEIKKEIDFNNSDLDLDLDVNPVFEGAMKIINGNNKPENISFEIKPIKNIRVDERENIYKAIFMSTNVNLYNSCVNLYPEIIKQEQKELFIEVLQIFDSNITDISITDDMIWIHSKNKRTMPMFSYGTGMQKALLLSLILVKSSGGIMLIDEIETAIHTSALIEVFSFIIKACKKLNVQLFATTHSLESVDKLLKAANYDEDFDEKNDIIRVITLRNSKKKTNARVLTGKQAFTNRNEYEMELRV